MMHKKHKLFQQIATDRFPKFAFKVKQGQFGRDTSVNKKCRLTLLINDKEIYKTEFQKDFDVVYDDAIEFVMYVKESDITNKLNPQYVKSDSPTTIAVLNALDTKDLSTNDLIQIMLDESEKQKQKQKPSCKIELLKKAQENAAKKATFNAAESKKCNDCNCCGDANKECSDCPPLTNKDVNDFYNQLQAALQDKDFKTVKYWNASKDEYVFSKNVDALFIKHMEDIINAMIKVSTRRSNKLVAQPTLKISSKGYELFVGNVHIYTAYKNSGPKYTQLKTLVNMYDWLTDKLNRDDQFLLTTYRLNDYFNQSKNLTPIDKTTADALDLLLKSKAIDYVEYFSQIDKLKYGDFFNKSASKLGTPIASVVLPTKKDDEQKKEPTKKPSLTKWVLLYKSAPSTYVRQDDKLDTIGRIIFDDGWYYWFVKGHKEKTNYGKTFEEVRAKADTVLTKLGYDLSCDIKTATTISKTDLQDWDSTADDSHIRLNNQYKMIAKIFRGTNNSWNYEIYHGAFGTIAGNVKTLSATKQKVDEVLQEIGYTLTNPMGVFEDEKKMPNDLQDIKQLILDLQPQKDIVLSGWQSEKDQSFTRTNKEGKVIARILPEGLDESTCWIWMINGIFSKDAAKDLPTAKQRVDDLLIKKGFVLDDKKSTLFKDYMNSIDDFIKEATKIINQNDSATTSKFK